MNSPVQLAEYLPPVGGVPAADKPPRARKSSYRAHRVVMLDPEANVLGFVHVRAVSEPQARRAALDLLANGVRVARCSEQDLIEIGRQGIAVLDAESGEWIGEHFVPRAIEPASAEVAQAIEDAQRPVESAGGAILSGVGSEPHRAAQERLGAHRAAVLGVSASLQPVEATVLHPAA